MPGSRPSCSSISAMIAGCDEETDRKPVCIEFRRNRLVLVDGPKPLAGDKLREEQLARDREECLTHGRAANQASLLELADKAATKLHARGRRVGHVPRIV